VSRLLVTRLESSHNQWLKTRVRVIFTKFLSPWWANTARFHTKKWSFFASVMIVIQFCKIGPNFLFCLCSRAMLHFRIKITFSRSNKDFTIYDLSISGTNPTTKLMQTILSHSLQRFVLIYSTLQHWLKFGNGQAEHALDSTSDSVTRVSDLTRITIFGDSDSTRVKLKKWWFESSRVTFFTEWLDSSHINDSSQSHFYKISEPLTEKPRSFAHKEMNISFFNDDQDRRKLSFLTA